VVSRAEAVNGFTGKHRIGADCPVPGRDRKARLGDVKQSRTETRKQIENKKKKGVKQREKQ
jgi:hypothetical protein